ncbi:MAG TPA: NCS1 family nucleobase:cation symporter-1 [Candidatus Synoicihabitans sp.]|nr:NCS1 family nucleobase:cation symporter-1 [Candidatus Synoicihabitans sp.]
MSPSPISASSLYNADLAPVPPERRTWTTWNIAALWIGMAVCIPTYTIASSLIGAGLTWWQALATVFLGNVIVLIPMTLNAHPGTAYGIPFPVLLRASFGTRGANIAALARGVVACGWFGIQTWIGGAAVYSTAALIFGFDTTTRVPFAGLGISLGELLAFLSFWAINVFFIARGMSSIKWLEILSAPFLLVIGAALLIWAVAAADGFGPIFRRGATLEGVALWSTLGAGLTAMVGFWATLSLNIPDFSRYARSQKAQIWGQAIGLPPTMTLYSFIGIVVTSATVVIFGETIWDPVQLITRFHSPLLAAIALVALAVATLSTNIAANVVSPANDFSNLAPRWISFKAGGLITAVIGIVMMPWKLLADPSGYVFTWLIGYSALLGPIAGVMIADYHVYRRRQLSVDDLYRVDGVYRYSRGFSLVALAAMLHGVLPNVPGFLVAIGAVERARVPEFFLLVYQQAWFVGFVIAFGLYLLLRKLAPDM